MRNFHTAHTKKDSEFEERVLFIRRVSKKTTGGNSISFSALVAIGDKKGHIGIGLGHAVEVPRAIAKAIRVAKKSMIHVVIHEDTLPHDTISKFCSAYILIKPAPQGAGLKVGSVMRTILSLAGYKNASGKIIKSRNKIANAYAIFEALQSLQERVKK